MKCYHLCLPPLLSDPPATRLPDANLESVWYGESWVRYPLDDTIYPLHHPHFFRAKCEFSIIMNHVATDLFGDKDIGIKEVSQEKLTNYLSDLKTWYTSLPAMLVPADIVYPFQFNLQ